LGGRILGLIKSDYHSWQYDDVIKWPLLNLTSGPPNHKTHHWLCLYASGVQRSGDARGDCLIGFPPSSIEQWRMVVLLLDLRCL